MKYLLFILVLLLIPTALFASYDDFILRIGSFLLTMHFHFLDGTNFGFYSYSRYWDLINLVYFNQALLSTSNTEIYIFLSTDPETDIISANISAGPGNMQGSELSAVTLEEIVTLVSAKLRFYMDLRQPAEKNITFYRLTVPLGNIPGQTGFDPHLAATCNLYIGPLDGMRFSCRYDLRIFDPALLQLVKTDLGEAHYQIWTLDLKRHTIDVLGLELSEES